MKDTVLKAIETVLHRAFPNHTVEHFHVKSGSSNGDNYLGVMYAIETKLIDFKTKKEETRNLILKANPENAARKEFGESLQVFQKEASVYTKLIPELIKFQENVISDKKNFVEPAFVPCIDVYAPASDSDKKDSEMLNMPWNYILMEDMRELENGGYKMADRIAGLDYKHCELVMKELAKYHALSYAYMKRTLKSPEELFDRFPFLKESMFTPANESNIKEIYESGPKPCKEFFKRFYTESCPEYKMLELLVNGVYSINSHYVAGTNDLSLRELASKPSDISDVNFSDRERKIKNQWLVLSHGDSWVNNFLFKYSGNVPVGVKLIDLQIVREICLTTDISYFLYMSTTGELRKNYLNKLLEVYFDCFMDTCKKLSVKPWNDFTLENLKIKYRNYMPFGAATACSFLPLIILPKDSVCDMEKESTEGNIFGSVFDKAILNDNENLKNRLISIVQECIEAGFHK